MTVLREKVIVCQFFSLEYSHGENLEIGVN